jgi:hypothetical protein
MRTRAICRSRHFGPALVAVGSQEVAEAFGCQVDLKRVIPCVIGSRITARPFTISAS